MSELSPMGSKYTDDQRIEAATQYAIKGNMAKVSKSLDIPESTLCAWKKTEWWDTTIAAVRSENSAIIRANYVKIVKAAQKQTMKELPNATAQQAATVGAIAYDKVRLEDSLPTKITGTDASLKQLSKQFDQMFTEYQQAHTISHQDGHGNEIDSENDN